MGAPALAAALAPRGRERSRGPLAFDRPGGPLVAVCSLVGGAGATTLALAIARQAARASTAPVLVTELAPDRAGLAVTTGRPSECCLLELAGGHRPDRPFAQLDAGLRLVASRPRPRPHVDPGDVTATVRRARAAHSLTVLDCGPLSTQAAPALALATHIVWVLPATAAAIDRALALFAADTVPPPTSPELLVAVGAAAVKPRVRDLRRVAEPRCQALALAPHASALADGHAGAAAEVYADALTALDRLVRR